MELRGGPRLRDVGLRHSITSSIWPCSCRSRADLVAAVWTGTGLLAIVLALVALVPLKLCLKLLHETGSVWWIAASGSIIACLAGDLGRSLWRPAIAGTFQLVGILLGPFIPDLILDPATKLIGSGTFQVIIAPSCSGLEGAGLMLVFSILWLWFFRHECRFPQAFLLIPVAVCLIWFLNSVRIASLILIGNAGAGSVAMGGFHSQAGWIAFNAAALGFSFALCRVPWLTTTAPRLSSAEGRSAENPTAWYVVPFLTLLAAAMTSHAATAGFEWLYPLRFFAAAGALWYFRRRYADLDWRFGWIAPVAGITVFVIWLGLDTMTAPGPRSTIAVGLASLSTFGRITWLVFRVLAATVTVPIAEELAFRGFLLRRLMSPDFDKVSGRRFTLVSVLVSSVLFGMLHGDRWLAGTIAGVLYALAYNRRGRIGDAVAAHGITNGLLAAWVLSTDNWQLW